VAYVYSSGEQKIYQASTTIFVQSNGGTAAIDALNFDPATSASLAASFSQLVTAAQVFLDTNTGMDKLYPGYDIANHYAGSSNPSASGSQELTLSVNDSDPRRAEAGVNALAGAFVAYVGSLENAAYQRDEQSYTRQIAADHGQVRTIQREIAAYKGPQAGLNGLKSALSTDITTWQTAQSSAASFKASADSTEATLTVLNRAGLPSTPIAPDPKRTALVAAFLALVLAGAGIYVYDRFDESMKTPEEVEEVAGVPILGTIPSFAAGLPKYDLITADQPRSPISEAYRLLRTNIQFADVDRRSKVLLITSCVPGEGKSTTTGNLAQVFAESGKEVLVVDTDLRRPTLHRMFGVQAREGLTNILSGTDNLNGHGYVGEGLPNLKILASGPLPPNPADILGSNRMQALVGGMRTGRDVVLFDSPPILSVADASVLASMVDGVILVIDVGKTSRRDLARARESVEGVGGKLLGVVINRLSPRTSGQYYYYYSHYYSNYYASNLGPSPRPALAADTRSWLGKLIGRR